MKDHSAELKILSKISNRNLHQAKRQKKDEFYTQLPDIENEVVHYWGHFRDKVVYCNCDDPYEKRGKWFFHYFSYQFEHLELKRLITACYKNPQMEIGQDIPERAYWLEYTGDKNGNLVPDPEEIAKNYWKGDGDFRSQECIDLLEQADIVVTNPPFSLFRKYVAQLMEYDKKFLIIGNLNAITYKEIFKLIKAGKIWLGHTHPKVFIQPDGSEKKFGNICWYTNLPTKRRTEDLILYRKYHGNESDYPRYDNYGAIEVSRVKNIPMDYEGVMGVPITFLGKHNPEQFEIVWTTDRGGDGMLEHIKLPHTRYDAPVVNERGLYKRIFIKNRRVKK